jgi:hypothetical protein
MNTSEHTKRQAMNAICHAETASQIGMVKLTGGIALYMARIREADRQAGTAPRNGRRTAFRSAIERDI